MTQKDKELLLKDLCARLPYGVKVLVDNKHWCDFNGRTPSEITFDNSYRLLFLGTKLGYVKPYLFPLSSMTEEQILAFWKIEFKDNGGFENDWDFPLYPPKVGNHFIIEALDWLNKNHFDYRGLIEKGLANDATGLNVY